MVTGENFGNVENHVRLAFELFYQDWSTHKDLLSAPPSFDIANHNSKCPAVPCTPSLSAAPRYNITLHPRPPSSIHGRRSSRANERPNPAFHSFEIFEAHTRLRAAGKSAVGKGVGGGTEYAHAESPLVLESVKLKINTASIT